MGVERRDSFINIAIAKCMQDLKYTSSKVTGFENEAYRVHCINGKPRDS